MRLYVCTVSLIGCHNIIMRESQRREKKKINLIIFMIQVRSSVYVGKKKKEEKLLAIITITYHSIGEHQSSFFFTLF